MQTTVGDLAGVLSTRKTMVLTTFRRDGTPVPTPVSVAVRAGRVFFRTYAESGKVKRLRRDERVEVTPSTFRGRHRGPTLAARAELLGGEDERTARAAIARRLPLLEGVFVPLLHRLTGRTTVHYEITPRPGEPLSTGGLQP